MYHIRERERNLINRTYVRWIAIVLIYNDGIWDIIHLYILEPKTDSWSGTILQVYKPYNYYMKIQRNSPIFQSFVLHLLTFHVLIRRPFVVPLSFAPSTTTSATWSLLPPFPRLPILINQYMNKCLVNLTFDSRST